MNCFRANNLVSFAGDMSTNAPWDDNMSKNNNIADMFLRCVQIMDMSGILKKNFPEKGIKKIWRCWAMGDSRLLLNETNVSLNNGARYLMFVKQQRLER